MKIFFFCMVAALTISSGHVFGQTAVELDASHFLAADIKELKLSRASFAEAVEQLRKAASSSEFSAPEVRVVHYATAQNSEDFPFREDGECVVSVRFSGASVHEVLETLCFTCGYALDLKHGQIRCFQVPHTVPTAHVFLSEGSAASQSVPWKEIALPSFKSAGMPLLDALELLRDSAAKASGRRVLPFVMVEHRSRPDDREASDHMEARKISLDLKKVPFVECLRYVSELGGCTYRVSPEGLVSVHDIHTLYHPRYTRVVFLADLARVMKVKQSDLTEEAIGEWLGKKIRFDAVPVIHRASGRVYFDWLHPDEREALRRLLSRD